MGFDDLVGRCVKNGVLGSFGAQESWRGPPNEREDTIFIVGVKLGQEISSFAEPENTTRALAEFYYLPACLRPLSPKQARVPPPPGHQKSERFVFVGIEVVIWNEFGHIVVAISKPFPGFFEVKMREFIALRKGLLLAKRFNLKVIMVETDARNVASLVNSSDPGLGDAIFILNDILALCKEVGNCRCQTISRCGNSLAHDLTFRAISSIEECLWQDINPGCFSLF
ncbi:hypothetical protein Dsin_025112 [Dipteronia sinensis]|uniref:RNase H type-1 domain-containing protein n=1 Tax=Dipteronia sinensis TaxID=43782 RepID=A0AAE0DWM7_9ROSI|nr:hypothetical protein Dsin_025112 [Dipteronia sinensis]